MRIRDTKLMLTAPFLAAATFLLTVPVSADRSQATSHTAATELEWMDSGFGPLVSPIQGDFASGGHVTYVRFSAGMQTPLHTHSHDYVGIVLTGVSMHWEPGKPETMKQLSAGSHWFMPAHVQHVSECLPGVECIMALYQQNFMDFLPAEK